MTDGEQFVSIYVAGVTTGELGWVVELDFQAVGWIGLILELDHHRAEHGFTVKRQYWGQGIAPEAANAVLDAAFRELPQLTWIFANSDARNVQSAHVMKKLGMRKEGALKAPIVDRRQPAGLIVCGLLRDDWERDSRPRGLHGDPRTQP